MKGFTVQVDNVSSRATARDLHDFFSFSGRILNIKLSPRDGHGNRSQIALVTFKDKDAQETALILSGSIIVDQPVNIGSLQEAMDQEFGWAEGANAAGTATAGLLVKPDYEPATGTRAQDVVASMVSRGHSVGRDAASRARALDEARQYQYQYQYQQQQQQQHQYQQQQQQQQQAGVNAAARLAWDRVLAIAPDNYYSNGNGNGDEDSVKPAKARLPGHLNAGVAILQSAARTVDRTFHISAGTMSVAAIAGSAAAAAGKTVAGSWLGSALWKAATAIGTNHGKPSSELPKVSRARA